MHAKLQLTHAWLLKGPLGVPGLCDIVVDYAKHFLPDFRHCSKILMLGFERQDRVTLLKDVLHHRRHQYTYGEAVTHVKKPSAVFFDRSPDREHVTRIFTAKRKECLVRPRIAAT
jgi:hypothetical protein